MPLLIGCGHVSEISAKPQRFFFSMGFSRDSPKLWKGEDVFGIITTVTRMRSLIFCEGSGRNGS